ncbi:MAG TPA: DUF58 domain-containing protein [Bryobacteraceae bacterium]|nr:DUF58 domain-containing protein [Bryobacteraceae bacterium]
MTVKPDLESRMGQSTPIVDQALLEKLERLALRWQKSFGGLVGGRHPAKLSGPGQEFLDHRHFHHGDDLRAINWRAYLRLEKLFLKMFQVEPRIPMRLLLDTSDSMTVGSHPKLDYAKRLVAALCYVGLVRLDTICLQPFAASLQQNFLCTGGRHRFRPIVDYLGAIQSGGRTNYLETARQFASTYPQRGLLIIVSDFLDDIDAIRPLQHLADVGHELFLVQLWSPDEREPNLDGEMELTDAETGTRVQLSLDDDARSAYTAAFDEHSDKLKDLANRNGGRYIGLSTSTELEEAIFDSLIRTGGVL